MSEHTKRTVKAAPKITDNLGVSGKLFDYNPYKVFDSRHGCIMAIALCVFLIIVFVLNVVLNGKWLSLIFVPFYILIIRNRLRKLREMA